MKTLTYRVRALVRAALRRLLDCEDEPGRPILEYAWILSETSEGEPTRAAKPWNWDPPTNTHGKGRGQEIRPRKRQELVVSLDFVAEPEPVRIERVLDGAEKAVLVARSTMTVAAVAEFLGMSERQVRARAQSAHRKLRDAALVAAQRMQ